MTLFELDDGRLVPAQFGREVAEDFTPEVLNAVRGQVLEIIARPLFPITWRDISHPNDPPTSPRLTALDASGQVVAVEVMQKLDAELLIESLSRLADTAAMSWSDLAREYPGAIEGFKVGWLQFRESMPPSPPNGPRLILVAGTITKDVRPALDVLASSGVEVHEMTLRQMSNGRAFLDVTAVGPRHYGHRANLLMGDSNAVPSIPGATEKPVVKTPAAVPPQQDVLARRSEPQRRAKPAARTFPSRMERRRTNSSRIVIPSPEVLSRSPRGLLTLAAMLGRPTPLSLQPSGETPKDARLVPGGRVSVPSGDFADPTAALVHEGIRNVDGWLAWHLGDEYGPTLAEALDEINRESRRAQSC